MDVFTESVIYYFDLVPFSFFTHNAYHLFFFMLWTLPNDKY